MMLDQVVRVAKLWYEARGGGGVDGIGVRVFWGYAAWNHTQMVAELAKRSWGIVRGEDFKETDSWIMLVDKACMAKQSEYSELHQ